MCYLSTGAWFRVENDCFPFLFFFLNDCTSAHLIRVALVDYRSGFLVVGKRAVNFVISTISLGNFLRG